MVLIPWFAREQHKPAISRNNLMTVANIREASTMPRLCKQITAPEMPFFTHHSLLVNLNLVRCDLFVGIYLLLQFFNFLCLI